jgi:large subunit ribosomal protein L23
MSFKQILRNRAVKNNRGRLEGTLTPYQIILAPVFTEKAIQDNEDSGLFVFKVHPQANKIDVKKAIQTIYDVEVANVRMMKVPSKGRANRKTVRKAYKKAMIRMKDGKTIELV